MGKVSVNVQAQVNGAYTNLLVVENFHDIHLGATPLDNFSGNPNLAVTTVTRQEVPTLNH